MKKKVLSLLITLVMVLGMFPAVSLANSSEAFADEAVPVLLGVNVTLADILDTSNGWLPNPVDKSAVFETGTGTASVNFSNSVLYTNGSFSTPAASKGAGGKYYFYITVTSLPEYNPVDYSKISVDHINVTMYEYEVDFLYAQDYVEGALTGMKFCFMATHNPAPKVMLGSVELKDGYYLQSGTPVISTNKPSGGYAYYYDGVLELNNYNSSSFSGLVLWDLERINIRVVGSNVLSKIEERYTSINTQKYTDIAFTGDGSLTVSSNTYYCVQTGGDVTVNSGSLNFGGANGQVGLSAASLNVNDGELVLKGKTSAINSTCKVNTGFIFVDENNTRWNGSTDLSTYTYLRINNIDYVLFDSLMLKDGYYLQSGAPLTSTTKPSGGYAYYKDGVLELNNYNAYYYSNLNLRDMESIEIKVVGTNLLSNIKESYSGVNTRKYTDITFTGDGSLTVDANTYYCVQTGGDVTVNSGNLTFGNNNGQMGLSAASLNVNDGELVLKGKTSAINSDCEVNTGVVFVDENGTIWDGSTDLSNYTYLYINNLDYIIVGGVAMKDGDYLANDATTTTTTQPEGGYAYYKDGTLTLRDYNYEGRGYAYAPSDGYSAVLYSETDLTVTLKGENKLVQTKADSDCIYVQGASLTIDGSGTLTATGDWVGIYADQNVVINGGEIITKGYHRGIHSEAGNVTINGGSVTAMATQVSVIGDTNYYNFAIGYAGSFSLAEGLVIRSSTTKDGTLGEYEASKHNTYKKIVVSDPTTITLSGSTADGIKVEVTNFSGIGVLVVAQYEGDMMVAVETKGAIEDDTYSFTGLTHKEGCTYKAILLGGLSLEPLCKADEF